MIHNRPLCPLLKKPGISHNNPAPIRCSTPSTFCDAKKRSTSMPSTNGDRIEAIGPVE
ncbi:hypothetical protein D3C75_1274990 [compost metagenome]